MTWSEVGGCFQVIDREDDDAMRVSVVEISGRRKARKLAVSVEARHVDDERVRRAIERLRVVLGLDRDIREFHELCEQHPRLKFIPAVGAGRGLRSARMSENIVKALCSTNVTWSQAVKMINRIGQLGPALPHFVNLSAWPSTAEILRAGEGYLVEVCRVGYRAKSILEFCRHVESGRFDAEALDEMARDPSVASSAILAKLRSIHGIGPSSAHYLLSFLGRHEHIAIDSATVAHVARVHMNGKRPTRKEIERIYEPFGKWKQLVFWYEHWLTWGTARQLVADAGLV